MSAMASAPPLGVRAHGIRLPVLIAITTISVGASEWMNLLPAAGTMSSLKRSLKTSANDCSRPSGPDAVRPVALLDERRHLALGVDEQRRRDEEDVEHQEDHDRQVDDVPDGGERGIQAECGEQRARGGRARRMASALPHARPRPGQTRRPRRARFEGDAEQAHRVVRRAGEGGLLRDLGHDGGGALVAHRVPEPRGDVGQDDPAGQRVDLVGLVVPAVERRADLVGPALPDAHRHRERAVDGRDGLGGPQQLRPPALADERADGLDRHRRRAARRPRRPTSAFVVCVAWTTTGVPPVSSPPGRRAGRRRGARRPPGSQTGPRRWPRSPAARRPPCSARGRSRPGSRRRPGCRPARRSAARRPRRPRRASPAGSCPRPSRRASRRTARPSPRRLDEARRPRPSPRPTSPAGPLTRGPLEAVRVVRVVDEARRVGHPVLVDVEVLARRDPDDLVVAHPHVDVDARCRRSPRPSASGTSPTSAP